MVPHQRRPGLRRAHTNNNLVLVSVVGDERSLDRLLDRVDVEQRGDAESHVRVITRRLDLQAFQRCFEHLSYHTELAHRFLERLQLADSHLKPKT